MSPAGLVWPRVQVLRALWPLLLVLLVPWKLWAVEDIIHKCTWQVVLREFDKVGNDDQKDVFIDQEPLDTVNHVFSMLVDAPIDPLERYLGFPYYLEIKYSCEGLTSKAQVRRGHLTGLKPVVLVTFQPPVNFYRWKIERLQIQMEAAPFLNSDPCVAEVCVMSWYTPMPIKNGSVVMYVDVSSNGLGPFIADKRFQMNINGFLKRKREDNEIHFIVGDTLSDLMPQDFVNITSSPLWYTINQSPVLILGGIPNEKYILLTDTSFNDFSLVELSIDSCWVGSFYCPQTGFTATIYDTIATESTLFIRQNQLVYYFTGTYSTLHEHDRGSGRWIRVLANECIKKLCPVPFHSNGSEYILALTTGKNEGYVHFGTITDGQVSFQMLPKDESVCARRLAGSCSITWALFLGDTNELLLLVEIEGHATQPYFELIRYSLATDNLEILYNLPEFIPDARGLEFLMILGVESFTSTPMIPKGLSYNPYSSLLFIWGNFLLLSYDSEDFIYLADFPKEQFIKYLVSSFRGDMVIVTENEEIWYYQESSYRVYQLFPSKGWEVHLSLQLMHQSSEYASNTTMLTLFYEDSELYQLVYLQDGSEGRLTKRLLPVEKILSYQQLENHYQLKQQGNYSALTFTNLCPFTVLRLRDLPKPQRFTRQERYRARAPYVLDLSGFHSEDSLAVYQGLVYYLLWLHSKYDKPYADPVHDPTWRWWKNKKQDKDYYFYLASNRRSVGGVHIDMDSYEKIYDLKSESKLPKHIFLDKGTVYSFSILLSSREHNFKAKPTFGTAFQVESQLELGVVLAHPRCIDVEVLQKVFINRNSVLFSIKIKDKMLCYDQGLSGHHLMKTSMTLKVVGTSGNCFKSTNVGDSMQVLELGVWDPVLGREELGWASTGVIPGACSPRDPSNAFVHSPFPSFSFISVLHLPTTHSSDPCIDQGVSLHNCVGCAQTCALLLVLSRPGVRCLRDRLLSSADTGGTRAGVALSYSTSTCTDMLFVRFLLVLESSVPLETEADTEAQRRGVSWLTIL